MSVIGEDRFFFLFWGAVKDSSSVECLMLEVWTLLLARGLFYQKVSDMLSEKKWKGTVDGFWLASQLVDNVGYSWLYWRDETNFSNLVVLSYSVYKLTVVRFPVQYSNLHMSICKLNYQVNLTFKPRGSICTARFNILKFWVLPTEYICVFHMVLTINSDCFSKQHNRFASVAETNMFPVRYELNFYVLFRRNPVLKFYSTLIGRMNEWCLGTFYQKDAIKCLKLLPWLSPTLLFYFLNLFLPFFINILIPIASVLKYYCGNLRLSAANTALSLTKTNILKI
jgi:hypothetical protein